MSDTDDALTKSQELQEWYRNTYISPEKDVAHYVSDSEGNSRRLPPPGLNARQKLEWANTNGAPVGRTPEPPVTLVEIGASPADFARLPPERKLALANEAMARRRKF